MTIIGITGHPASGKDMAAEYFTSKGFKHVSMGDFLREMMKTKNIPTDRPHIREFVKEMRAVHGNQYPADEMAKGITGNTVISGFRNVAEVKTFREKFGNDFILLAIDAPLEVRYRRIYGRGRHGDNISFEQFKEEEDRERREESGSHEMDRVIEIADKTIENSGTKEELYSPLEEIL